MNYFFKAPQNNPQIFISTDLYCILLIALLFNYIDWPAPGTVDSYQQLLDCP